MYFNAFAFANSFARCKRVFLLAMYGKNEKANLTKAERNAMTKLIPALISGYPKGRGRKG